MISMLEKNKKNNYADGIESISCFKNLSRAVVFDASFQEGDINPFQTDSDVAVVVVDEEFGEEVFSDILDHITELSEELDEDDAWAIGLINTFIKGYEKSVIILSNLHSAFDALEELENGTDLKAHFFCHANKENVQKELDLEDSIFAW